EFEFHGYSPRVVKRRSARRAPHLAPCGRASQSGRLARMAPGSWAALLVVDATDGPDDFRHIRAGIAPAPRRAAVIAEAVARAQQDDAILEPQFELASQHQADLLAHAGGEQLLARGAARFDTGAAQIQRASRRRRVHFL